MRIVVLTGFTSSGVVIDGSHKYRGGTEYLGGGHIREEIEKADVVIGVWPPERGPIVIKAPEDVQIAGAHWSHLKEPIMVDPTTPAEMDADIQRRAAEWDRKFPS